MINIIGTAIEMSKNKTNNNFKNQTKMTTPDNTNLEAAGPVDPNTKAVANAATQTLFRFVSMRNPQLAKKDGNLRFIFRKEEYKGEFDKLLKDWKPELLKSKIDFLTEKVKSPDYDLTKFFRSQQSITTKLKDLYNATSKLIENGEISADDITAAKSTTLDERKKLWDSLIYQVLVQEDFYAKELLTQMLQTIHYAVNYDSFSTEQNQLKKEEKQKEVATAKAVIPDHLLIDSATDDGEENTSSKYFTVGESEVGGEDYISGEDYANKSADALQPLSSQSVAGMQKRQNVALATYQKQQLENLKKDLLKVQKQYRKNYQKQYDAEYKNYQTQIKPELEQYEQRLLEAEAGLEETASKASKDLALKRVQKPNIPDFEFRFENEQDYLRKRLSENALGSLSGLIGKVAEKIESQHQSDSTAAMDDNAEDQEIVFSEDEYQSFDEILELVNEKLAESNEQIYQNTEVEKQQYASVGGVLIPVNNTTAAKTEYKNFTAQTIFRNSAWSVMLTFADKSVYIVNAYEKYIANNSVSDNSIVQYTNGIYQLFDGANMLSIINFKNGFPLNVNFTLSDGKKYKGSVTLTRAGALTNNTNESGYLIGSSSISLVENPGDNDGGDTGSNPDTGDTDTPSTPVSTNNSFVPKGFGIKRLGIADYLKVEQTTHAYVEGEVANIENIMAREYRSQSTRRLRRSETIDTKSSDTERERSTDSTTSSRFEMQSEISQILQEATDLGVNVNTGIRYGDTFSLNVAGSYANHRSKEDSMRQAVTQAQEITARALDRVVTKVHQERVEKMIEEFEENNTHGFDNRKGDQHVVGVYRWVDKLMKNRVWNYGKRMMFEFAIPQPSKLHTLAAASVKNTIVKPVDPRTAKDFTLADFSKISDDTVRYWSGYFNVEMEDKPQDEIFIGKSFNYKATGESKGNPSELASESADLEIPTGYQTLLASAITKNSGDYWDQSNPNFWKDAQVLVGNTLVNDTYKEIDAFIGKIPISYSQLGLLASSVNINIKCQLTQEAKKQYQQKTFNAIIKAYEDALADYNNKVAEENAKADNIKDGNPMFYRQIEQEVLKHNSIAYLVDDSFSKNNKVLGKDLYTGKTVKEFEVTRTGLDDYASLAKFMEQAFEWDIMSYNYYPYYWGKRDDWDDMYQQENIDPLFRSFLRSGMARVVVTVRPGFEDAVQFYMSTGRLWNGGEVPVIGDPMYLSLVDEMKDVKGEAQGKPWITRLPTPLTILQAESIGLKVLSALPFTKEDPALFENPEEVITVSNFFETKAMIESGTDKQVANINLDEDSLLLTTDDDQVVSELPLEELRKALE